MLSVWPLFFWKIIYAPLFGGVSVVDGDCAANVWSRLTGEFAALFGPLNARLGERRNDGFCSGRSWIIAALASVFRKRPTAPP